MSNTASDALDLAIKLATSQSELARRLKIKPPQISKWKRKGAVPIERVPAVSNATGLPMHVLRPDRPDMFPPPQERAA